jgi:Domain of unknown function (DUF5011)
VPGPGRDHPCNGAAPHPPSVSSGLTQTGASPTTSTTSDLTQTGTQSSTATSPVLALNGLASSTITVGDTYADLGARIVSPQADLNLGLTTLLDGATTTQLQLDTTQPGIHTITYVATDPNGLYGSISRTVSVILSSPVIAPPANDNPPPLAPTGTDGTTTPEAPPAPAPRHKAVPPSSSCGISMPRFRRFGGSTHPPHPRGKEVAMRTTVTAREELQKELKRIKALQRRWEELDLAQRLSIARQSPDLTTFFRPDGNPLPPPHH